MQLLPLWLLLIGAIFPQPGYSQQISHAPIIAYNHTFTAENGLSQNNVSCITKDKDGFIWMGTGEGLNRFDGYSFVHYTHSDKDTTSLSNKNVFNMLVDSKGRLWIGTFNGLNLYDSKTEGFRKFLFDPESKINNNINTILALVEDRHSQLWVASYGEIYKIDLNTLKVTEYDHRNDGTGLDGVTAMILDRNGKIWASTGKGICILSSAVIEHMIPHSDAPGGLPSDRIISMAQDGTGAIYFGTNGAGIFKLKDENDRTFERFTSPGSLPFLGSDLIGALGVDKDGKLLVGTDGGGVFRQDETGIFTPILGNQSRHLHNGTIGNIFVDEWNNYWFSVHGSGVQLVYASSKRFEHYRYFDLHMESIEKNSVLAIVEDKNQKIWIGTDGAGLYRFDPRSKSFTSFRHSPTDKNSLSSNVIKSLLVDKNNNIYAGTFGGGLNYLDTKTGTVSRFVHIPGNSESISTNHVWSLLEDSRNRIYVGQLSGFNEFDPDRKVFKVLPVITGQIYSPSIFSLAEDRNGNIWVGTRQNGLHQYNPNTKTFTPFSKTSQDATRFPTNEIVQLTPRMDGKLWIGTGDIGFVLFDPESFRYKSYVEAFSEKSVNNVFEDDSQNIWFTTADGVHKWDVSNLRVYDYTISDGLQGTQFNDGTRLKGSDGIYYLGGTNGLNVFRPENITDDTTKARVVFTKLSLFNTPVRVNDKSGLLTESITQTRSITLQADQNVFSLEFASLDFNFPKKNKYRYFLEGFDKTWNDANTSRIATYTNLPAGEYTLKISAPNRSGVLNESAASIKIIVIPRWYERIETKLGAGLFLIIFAAFIIHYRTKLLFRQKVRLEELISIRTRELQLANAEIQKRNQELVTMEKQKENMLAVMSHEIRTPLNSMIGLTHVLKRRNPRADQVEIIDTLKNSGDHLLHLVNDVLDYNKITTGKLYLEVLRFNLIETLKQLHSMFARLADEKNIQLSVQIGTTLPTFVIGDPTRLLQILSNLISNGVKFTAQGSVILYARQIAQSDGMCTVEFKVEDTGIGIPSDKLHLLYQPFSQVGAETHRQYGGSGLGLLIVKNLVEAMNGTVAFDSIPGKMTIVTVTIPFSIEHEPEHHDQSISQLKIEMLKGTKVLYTEDIASNQFLVKTLLADYEIDCDVANDGAETISKISEQEFDVILVDVQLPDIDGYELTAKIRSHAESKNKKTPVILFSAHTGIHEEAIKNCGANDFIGKPFKPEDLFAKIQRSVHARQKEHNA